MVGRGKVVRDSAGGPRRPPRRRSWWAPVGIAVAMAAVLLIIVARQHRRAALAAAEQPAPASPSDAWAAWRARLQTTLAASRGLSPPPGVAPRAGDPSLPFATRPEDDRWRGYYKGLSGALPRDHRRQLPFSPHKYHSIESEPQLVIWMDSERALAGQTTMIRAMLVDGVGRPVAPETADISVSKRGALKDGSASAMEPTDRETLSAFQYAFYADPASLPFASGAGGASTAPPVRYHFTVNMSGTFESRPFARQATGSFLVESPGGLPRAGSAQVQRRGDDLVVTVTASVDRPGRYWAGAELWGGSGGQSAIAYAARPLGQLEAGDQSIELTFGGALIAERGIDGPYTVANVRLNQVDTVPPHRSPVLPDVPTPPYLATEFGASARASLR
jgi:hypothetical protein